MPVKFILSEYVERAITEAFCDRLEDGTCIGPIPRCKGLVAFGGHASRARGIVELHPGGLDPCGDEAPPSFVHLSVIADIDINTEPVHESVGPCKYRDFSRVCIFQGGPGEPR